MMTKMEYYIIILRDHVDDLDDDNDGILDIEDEDDDGDGILDREVNIVYVAVFSALGKWDRCHCFWPTYSTDIIVEGKRKRRGKETP